MSLIPFLSPSLFKRSREGSDGVAGEAVGGEKLETPELDRIVEEASYYENVDKESYSNTKNYIAKFKSLIENASKNEEQFMLMGTYEEADIVLQRAVDSLSSISSAFIAGDSDDIDIVTALANELSIEGKRVLEVAKEVS